MNKRKHLDNMEIIQNMTLMDDIFMTVFFENQPECIEEVLSTVLPFKSKVESVETQCEYNNIYGRSVRFDILARDEKNTFYDIEIQKSEKGATPKIARYYSSMLDTKALRKNSDFHSITDTYVIFITEKDVLKGNRPMYSIERSIKETGGYFDDGEHIIYINTAYKGDGSTEIEKLIHDFKSKESDNFILPHLCRRYSEIKNGKAQKEVDKMCELLDQRIKQERAEGQAEGRAEGRVEERKDLAKKMILKQQFEPEMIAELCELTVDEVNEIKSQLSA